MLKRLHMMQVLAIRRVKVGETDRLSCQGVLRFREEVEEVVLTPVKPLIWLRALDEQADRFDR